MDFYFQEHLRLDWGLGNPNKTAVLIACLMMACHAIRLLFPQRKLIGWLLFSVVFLGLGICLVHTYSRGGAVAAIVGQLFVWKFRWPGKWDFAVVFALGLLLIGYAALPKVNATQRYAQGAEDRSITNRLRIWKDTPRMMVDAPGGWGLGKSGHAWTQWYQPMETKYSYRTLVNSHLTWLAEFGWMGRFGYLFGWLLILALALARNTKGVCAGVWAAFGVGAVFSSVAESWILWVVPGAAFVGLGLLCRPKWSRRTLLIPGGGAVLGTLMLFGIGLIKSGQEPTIKHGAAGTSIGKAPKFVLVQPDSKVLGRHFGYSIRNHPEPGWLVTDHLPAKPLDGKTIILSGEIAEDIDTQGPTVYLNPLQNIEKNSRLTASQFVMIGELRKDSVSRQFRRLQKSREFVENIKIIPGKQIFLGDWVLLVHEINQ